MLSPQERAINEAAYKRLRSQIDQSYPVKHYVAIDRGEIVGASADFWELYNDLRAGGRDPQEVLVVLAGVEHPEHGVIL